MLITELKDFFANELQNGSVRLHLAKPVPIALLERNYPWALGRIVWEAIEGFSTLAPEYRQGEKISSDSFVTRYSTRAREFLLNCDPIKNRDQEETVFISGDMDEAYYETSIEVFISAMTRTFNPGENVYVVPFDARWCIGFTMEKDIFFAHRPIKVPREFRVQD